MPREDPKMPSPSALPDYAVRVFPELATAAMPVETRATCDRCAMAPEHRPERDHPRSFTAEARCCTYIPKLPNFVVGRILRRGDEGARRMLARLRSIDDGVTPAAVASTKADLEQYTASEGSFGQLDRVVCPYWVGGPRACSIWVDRNAVCRTWHCRFVDGAAGFRAWTDLHRALIAVERRLADWCVDRGEAPAPDADRDAWLAWYLWCAAQVDAFDADAIRQQLDASAIEAASRAATPIPPLVVPDLLMSRVTSWRVHPEQVELYGYSPHDACIAPPWIFLFLSRLDGKTPWREAAAALHEATGHLLDEGLVRTMVQRGVLGEADERDLAEVESFRAALRPG